MITTRSTLIRTDNGGFRVYRPFASGRQFHTLRYTVSGATPMCRSCGCIARAACFGGCGWANAIRTLCSRCAGRMAR